MLKPYSEMIEIDVRPHCDMRDAKDDNGKKIQVPYLNWAKCKQLLHENGAETVYYTPVKAPDGGYLFTSKTVSDKNGRVTGCYFVSVEIHIDDLTFTMDMPLMNGAFVVYDDTLNQLRISNAHARAFVKGVAIRTGLGFKLWLTDKDTDAAPDDLSGHSVMAVKQRLEQLITVKMQDGMDLEELLRSVGLPKKRFDAIMQTFNDIRVLEDRVKAL